MHNLSITQALSIWSDLESALRGENNYGGDTAELYVYRFMRAEPVATRNPNLINETGMFADMVREAYDTANTSMFRLLSHFAKTRKATIEVEGKPLGKWLKTARFAHRVHVKVTERENP